MGVCFTGHRPQNLPWGFDENNAQCLLLKRHIQRIVTKLYKQYGQLCYISGMGLGVDIWAAEIVLSLREHNSNITLEAAVPFKAQAERWPPEDQERYVSILNKCDKVNFMQDKNNIAYQSYDYSAIWQRNHYMVNRSDYVVAIWDFIQKRGGTYGTLKYATNKNKAIILINPVTLKMYVRKVKEG